MRQVLSNLATGDTSVSQTPVPSSRPGHLLIASRRSLISAGTERMLVEFGQANLLAKARSQPDKVRQVLDKIRTDGLLPTMQVVFSRLDQPLPLGYCNAGVVLEVGAGVTGFQIGDRVASNGPHAEIVSVPKNLCARIPDSVSDDEAAFTVLAAVGLQGVRLANPTLGENVTVIGLGLVGLLTVQMLAANGCRVLGVDFDPHKLELARQFGAKTVDLSAGGDPVTAGLAFSGGQGVDAVLIAAATKSSDPVQNAAQMCRKRGRIVLVGVTGLQLSRPDFYEKELTFQVSCSYGPGRYDENYEQRGQDYPLGFVRWTEQRNFEAVLGLMAAGRLNAKPLISDRIPQTRAADAYHKLVHDHVSLGIVLTYPETGVNRERTWSNLEPRAAAAASEVTVAMIGAGNFATLVLLPALSKTEARLRTVASAGGASAAMAAHKFGFEQATSDYQTVLDDPDINTVFIATRHDSHAALAAAALQAGKHVFVEKPLALNREELTQVQEAWEQTSDRQLMVGFNRRFAPLAVALKSALASRSEPMSMVYTVNAGTIPAAHWTQDPAVGGGRIIGEGCHFIELLRFLADAPIVGVQARMMGEAGVPVRQDKMSIMLEFGDGSTGTIHYLANGSKRFPKERVEVFCQGGVTVLDNFKSLTSYGWPNIKRQRVRRQDKGHKAEISAFVDRVRQGGEPLIPWQVLKEVTLVSFDAVERALEPPRGLTGLD